jgi:hypothetical protein
MQNLIQRRKGNIMNKSSSSISLKKVELAFIGGILSIGLAMGTAAGAGAATVVQTPTAFASASRLAATATMTDADFNALVSRLEQLPESVQQANPKTIPNYAGKLDNFLAGGSFSDARMNRAISPLGTNWPNCIFQIGLLVVQYGIPVAKVVGWLKEAKAIWGGVTGIWKAIRSGWVAAKFGSQAGNILSAILGADGVIRACFNS